MSLRGDVAVAIAGGGMAGASLALLCAQACPHWRIRLVEESPFIYGEYHPSFDARNTALAAGSMAIFSRLGLAEKIRQEAAAITRVHVSDQGYLPGQQLQREAEPLGYVVPNAWLGRVLWEALRDTPQVEVVAGRVQSLAIKAGYNQVITDTDQHFTSAVTVVADGAASPLRRALGIEVQSKSYRQRAIIANLRLSQPHNGVAYERFTRNGPLALLPLGAEAGADRMAMVWTWPEMRAEHGLGLSETECLRLLQRELGYRAGRLVQLGHRESYSLHMQVAREQVRTQVVLLGNAAHSLHPVAGQGFNLTLRDAMELAATWQQASNNGQSPGDLGVLQAYQQQRQQDQWLTKHLGDQLVETFSRHSLPHVALRHTGLLGLELMPALKQAFQRQMAGEADVDTMQMLARRAAGSEQ